MNTHAEYICKHIVKMLQTEVKIYDSYCNLIKSYGSYNGKNDYFTNEIKDKLFSKIKDTLSFGKNASSEKTNKQTKKVKNHTAEKNSPVLFVDKYNIAYGCVVSKEKDIFIIGPVYIDKYTKEIDKYEVNYSNMKNGMKISKYDLSIFSEEILLLHNMIHETSVTYGEMIKENFGKQNIFSIIQKEIADTSIKNQSEYLHNPYEREVRILGSITNGDTEKLKLSLDEVFAGKYGVLAKDKLRSAKNLAICHIVLASRASIKGGVPSETAYSVCDYFVLKIEDTIRIENVEILEREAQFYYADLVFKYKNKSIPDEKNPLIEQCKNIIFKNINKKIVIKDIANTLKINADYLSKIFHDSEKITVHEYIMKEKIEIAETMLIYSNQSFYEIALNIGFCSQSHFTKVFRKYKNITPQKFRKKYGAQNDLIQNI